MVSSTFKVSIILKPFIFRKVRKGGESDFLVDLQNCEHTMQLAISPNIGMQSP